MKKGGQKGLLRVCRVMSTSFAFSTLTTIVVDLDDAGLVMYWLPKKVGIDMKGEKYLVKELSE